MSGIQRLQQKIEKTYRSTEGPKIDVPPALQVMHWISFATDYIAAASLIDEQAPQRWLPRLQMAGQAVESALKACLVSAHREPPNHHNLAQLYELASEHGFTLDDPDLAAIVHLGHFYFQDVATGTRYKTRYPTEQTERLGGAVPYNSVYVSIVRSLIKQAAERSQVNIVRQTQ
jgi:hypothetical protein